MKKIVTLVSVVAIIAALLVLFPFEMTGDTPSDTATSNSSETKSRVRGSNDSLSQRRSTISKQIRKRSLSELKARWLQIKNENLGNEAKRELALQSIDKLGVSVELFELQWYVLKELRMSIGPVEILNPKMHEDLNPTLETLEEIAVFLASKEASSFANGTYPGPCDWFLRAVGSKIEDSEQAENVFQTILDKCPFAAGHLWVGFAEKAVKSEPTRLSERTIEVMKMAGLPEVAIARVFLALPEDSDFLGITKHLEANLNLESGSPAFLELASSWARADTEEFENFSMDNLHLFPDSALMNATLNKKENVFFKKIPRGKERDHLLMRYATTELMDGDTSNALEALEEIDDSEIRQELEGRIALKNSGYYERTRN